MAARKAEDSGRHQPVSEVFDRAHLAYYTMNSAELEREIIMLFLQQLPMTIEMIEEAKTAAEWKLATHTLKGAAAGVGANRLQAIAVDLERLKIDVSVKIKNGLMSSLQAAAEEFQATVRQIYP